MSAKVKMGGIKKDSVDTDYRLRIWLTAAGSISGLEDESLRSSEKDVITHNVILRLMGTNKKITSSTQMTM